MDLPDTIIAFFEKWPVDNKKKLLAVCAMYDEGTELAEIEHARAGDGDSFRGIMNEDDDITIDEHLLDQQLSGQQLSDSHQSDSQLSDDNQIFEDANEYLESTAIRNQANLLTIAEDSGEHLDDHQGVPGEVKGAPEPGQRPKRWEQW